ncbi:MAG TPA: sorbosone dehydrogenase [Gammaproteobacteria bacterium]|nr:sorbosone dehydrogenase [Gammaproteobacteria bacterium]
MLLALTGTGNADARLSLAPGFSIETLPFAVPNARQMALTDAGALIVGTRKKGRVYAVVNPFTDNPRVITLIKGLKMPSGVAVVGSDLYVAATSTVYKVANIDQQLQPNPTTTVITDALPNKRHHGWKYLKAGPDGQLYLPVGAPCNVCLSDDPRFATMLRMDPETGATEIIGHGIRNSVGFDWQPSSGDLWVSDNGRDMMGDDIPSDEINVIPAASEKAPHYGYPFIHSAPDGSRIKDPKFGDHPAAQSLTFVDPAIRVQAHAAVLGMSFYRGERFPAPFQDALFVAEHGSWNRSKKVGYQVSVATFDTNGLPNYQPFITGWLKGENAWGRPNDVLPTPDGALLISDDKAGVIYRVTANPTALALAP